jgi:hypothetical protein
MPVFVVEFAARPVISTKELIVSCRRGVRELLPGIVSFCSLGRLKVDARLPVYHGQKDESKVYRYRIAD